MNKDVRITAKYNTADFEKLKEAFLILQKIEFIRGITIHKLPDNKGKGIAQFMIEYDKLEYPNTDNTELIVVENI